MDSIQFRIERQGLQQALQSQNSASKAGASNKQDAPLDNVSISSDSIKTLDNISRLRNMEEIRANRIEELREQVRTGKYPSSDLIDKLATVLTNRTENYSN
ncbi:MAG: flagellar biosynthesis anti-sigma factor FlgM [Verrucomicrobiota bacterium]